MSRLAAAALRRAVVTASAVPSSSRASAFAPVAPRLFSTDAPAEATAGAAAVGSQDERFLKPADDGLVYARFKSALSGGSQLGKNMLKTDIIHYLDKCELSLDDVKVAYTKEYYPVGALLRFPSMASFITAIRQTSQGRLYKIERLSRDMFDRSQSYDGKTILLHGIPRNAMPEDIERFLCGTNIEPPPFEGFNRLWPGPPGVQPTRTALVKFRTKTDATNAFITKNRGFCLNNPVSMRVLQ